MAGTTTTTVTELKSYQGKHCRLIRVDWTGDASTGTVPDTQLTMTGFIAKIVTIPGTPSPTTSYNVKLLDPDAPTIDCLISLLNGRSATAAEQVYTAPSLGQLPVYVASGRDTLNARPYALNITGNSVASAKGSVLIYVLEEC